MSLTLRLYQPSDAAMIASWLKNEYLMRQWCTDRYERYPVTPEDMNTYHARHIDGQYSRALTIEVGDFTIYNDFVNDPRDFEKNNVLYHYPINNDRLIIGKFCSIACGAKFIFNCANRLYL